MRFTSPLLLTLVLAACATPGRREPHPVSTEEPREEPRQEPREDPAPAPAAEGLDRETEALLGRLLIEQPTPPAAGDDPDAPVDERPLTLLVDWELGSGPFVNADQEVPPGAIYLSLAAALARHFEDGGALRGPLRVDELELETWGGALPEPGGGLPDGLRALGEELGARYSISGRLDRLEHEHIRVYLPRARRYRELDRGQLEFTYRLHDLESGTVVCESRFARTFDLDGLSPDELASAEWTLAWEAARLVTSHIESCLAPGEPVRQD